MADDNGRIHFDLTGTVRGVTSENGRIEIAVEEKGGAQHKWSTKFGVNQYDAVQRGQTYTFRVSLAPNPKKEQYPYRDLSELKGEADAAAITSSEEYYQQVRGLPDTQAASTPQATNGNRSGYSPQDKQLERASIQSQSSVGAIIRLVEANWELEEIEAKLPKILELAAKIEAHHIGAQARHSTTTQPNEPQTSQGDEQTTPKRSTRQPRQQTASSVEQIITVPQFMNYMKDLYPEKAKSDFKKRLEDALQQDISTIKNFGDAVAFVKLAWDPEAPPTDSSESVDGE